MSLTGQDEELMVRLLPERDEEEAFVTSRLPDDECRAVADPLRRIVLQVEEQGGERCRTLLGGAEPAPRRSGHRPRS
ncbi:hypothetical protein ACIBBD_12685 [Streptomyces sp. NPDC051315]|uniref:hypothetical protein n=1 Tax=Streptomyces sp. NPDC051315 TaxID=3365650 RepID=UPI0037B6BB67